MPVSSQTWEEKNQKHLSSSIDNVIALLQEYLLKVNENDENKITQSTEEDVKYKESKKEKQQQSPPPQQEGENFKVELDNYDKERIASSFSNLNEPTKQNNDDFAEGILSSSPPSQSILPPSSDLSLQTAAAAATALESIVALFGLSEFEKLLLVLCAGIELNSKISQLCKKIHQDDNMAYPTFGLALAALPGPHMSALSPISPLRRFKLIEIYGFPHQMPLTGCILRIDERVLHYLLGISYLEKRLWGIIRPVQINMNIASPSFPTAQSYTQITKHIMDIWKQKQQQKTNTIPIVKLTGIDKKSKLTLAQTVCQSFGLALWIVDAESIPLKSEELESFIQLWMRESALLGAGLYISVDNNNLDASKQKSVEQLIENVRGVLFLDVNEALSYSNVNFERESVSFEVKRPLKSEQKEYWRYCLDNEGYPVKTDDYDSLISKLVNQFDMDFYSIQLVCSQSHLMMITGYENSKDYFSQNKKVDLNLLFSALWDSCRLVSRPKMDTLAQRIIPTATMSDIVLAPREKMLLDEIILHVKQKTKVYEEWGWDKKKRRDEEGKRESGEGKEKLNKEGLPEDDSRLKQMLLSNGNNYYGTSNNNGDNTRGMGITALFSGDSGTGKTMAAEALANELNLDLFRIDLSMVVSKYIGETEKNLRQIFDTADQGNAILFFDEADTLFGKRTEVKDSHDRYANIEVGYLLQRMESYNGLAILTTNMKSSLDSAFMRRIRFIVNFQFPDETRRLEIWKRVFPKYTPKGELDIHLLASLTITGGQIRNIAMNASFLAANQGIPVNMSHIKQSVKNEYNKIERPLTNIGFEN